MGFGTLSLKGRALRLLAQREHSRAELTTKLARHVQEGDDLAALLDDLQAKDFINETRVGQSVVYRRAPRMGAARIRQELLAKGLGSDAVQERKFGQAADDLKGRARQMRFLLARGFSGDVVRRVVPQLKPPAPPAEDGA